MTDNTYNGWTNYATWRVNLEIFDGSEWAGYTADSMRDYVEDVICDSAEGIARDYALAFVSDVNWHEIAAHYADETEDEEPEDADA